MRLDVLHPIRAPLVLPHAFRECEQVGPRPAMPAHRAVAAIARFNARILDSRPDLLKIKYQRMAADPFAFFRGTDHLFFSDRHRELGRALGAGPEVMLQGDAHLMNFGAVLGPHGAYRLGPDDFDEAIVGPPRLDLERMAASLVLAGEQAKLGTAQQRQLVAAFADGYRKALEQLVHGSRPAHAPHPPAFLRKQLEAVDRVGKGHWTDDRLSHGGTQIARSATIRSLPARTAADLRQAFEAYARAAKPRARKILAPYRVSDVVEAVAGDGSVGRARYRLLLTAPGARPRLLEFKEEVPPAATPYLPDPVPASREAARVVAAQRIMMGHPDPLLGTARLPARDALMSRSFLIREVVPQLPLDPTRLDASELLALVRYHGQTLAVAHARSATAGLADAGTILASLGDAAAFRKELANFAQGYARQVNADFKAFRRALRHDPLLRSQFVATG